MTTSISRRSSDALRQAPERRERTVISRSRVVAPWRIAIFKPLALMLLEN